MATPRRSRWLLASAGGHAAVFALLVALHGAAPVTAPPRPPRVTEFSVEAPLPPMPPSPPTPAPPVVAASRTPRTATTATVPRLPAPARSPLPPAPASVPAVLPVTPPPTATTPPVLRAADLFRPGAHALALPSPAAPGAPAGPGREAYFAGSTGTAEERAREASEGFVREALGAATVREAPGVRTYLWNVRRRVAEAWRPGVVRVPNLGDTLMAGFIAPERAIRIFGDRMMRRQRQLLEAPAPRMGGAADAIEAIGGVSGQGLTGRPAMPANTSDESWRRNVRTTRAEVQVDQDDAGRVLDVRLLHPSGIPGFDRAAIEAVRLGLQEQDPMPLPGGRRSRWSFTVVATRRLFTPSVGGAFDESRGWFRIEVPGQVTLRSRVQMEASAAMPAAAARP